jgi:hypothetical protein
MLDLCRPAAVKDWPRFLAASLCDLGGGFRFRSSFAMADKMREGKEPSIERAFKWSSPGRCFVWESAVGLSAAGRRKLKQPDNKKATLNLRLRPPIG